jgi:hypothetical protein
MLRGCTCVLWPALLNINFTKLKRKHPHVSLPLRVVAHAPVGFDATASSGQLHQCTGRMKFMRQSPLDHTDPVTGCVLHSTIF